MFFSLLECFGFVIANGVVDYFGNHTAKVYCGTRFRLVGNSTRKCEDGRWSGYTPVCVSFKPGKMA